MLVVAVLAAVAAAVVVGAAALTAEEVGGRVDRGGGAEAAAGLPAVRARTRGPRRRRGDRPPPRSGAPRRQGKRQQAAAHLRPLRLARGEARRRLRGLAGERGPDRAARRPLSAQLVRAAPRRARPASGPGTSGALTAWREARDVEPDTPYAVRAGDFIHARDFAPGLPGFVVSFDYRIEGKTPAEQLRRLAADRTLRGRLLYGIALQGLGRPVSARRAFAEARELAPNNVDALVADAVGRYDKGNPSASFSRLGPLSRRFPHAATVRFHLGVLLLWQKNVKEAMRQLELARTAEPGSKIAAEAKRYLDAVRNAGTS